MDDSNRPVKKQKSIDKVIENVLAVSKYKVKVLPLMCGSGKSTAISALIKKAIEQEKGLLIVTDRIYRFTEYLEPRDAEIFSYLHAHSSKSVSVLTAKTAGSTFKNMKNHPVLMMTSQRFLAMELETLNDCLAWNGGDQKRSWIIFDEMPELYFQFLLDESVFDRYERPVFHSMLDAGLSFDEYDMLLFRKMIEVSYGKPISE